MDHFRRRKSDLVRSRIKAATQCKALRLPRLSGDISSIDSNGRRAKELKFAGHSLVADKYFMDFCRNTFCSQDIFDHPYSCVVRRAFRHVQDFDFHFSLSSFRGFLSPKIGQ